jgi:hypothetical protein
MDKESVPQDNSPTYAGLRKLLYAVDANGKYTGVPSTGWEVESYATEAAVSELDRLRIDAWQRARDGKTSALEYHMYANRMEPDTLSATTGIWRWRVRRHFDPRRFAKLSERMLTRYAEAMGITVEQLIRVPESSE